MHDISINININDSVYKLKLVSDWINLANIKYLSLTVIHV